MRCWADGRLVTKPESRSTFRCFETVGWLSDNPDARSPTPSSPPTSAARMRRRVGSATTRKTSTVGTTANILAPAYTVQGMLYGQLVIGVASALDATVA